MREKILDILEKVSEMKMADLVLLLEKDRTTIYRHLKKMEIEWEIIQTKKWWYSLAKKVDGYFDIPFWEREKKWYNPDFLKNYIPNKTFFLSEQNRTKLENAVKFLSVNTDFYKNNKKFIERLLIDLSFASSYLEGNTYSYLDTEVLLKYNEINKEKTKEETEMILNHKRAIEYMIFFKKELEFNKKTFFEIHSLLWKNLLNDVNLWVIRDKIVEIGGSTYKPLENRFLLNEQFEIFLEKCNEIKNPFEKSIFIMIFIPYFQIFLDINKRTSRIMANLVFVQNNLPLLSMIEMEKKKYILSILSVYELNDTSLMEKNFVENYLLNLEKYKKFL